MTTASTPVRVGIVLCTLATALVHLSLNFPDAIFILNGAGYLALLVALFAPVPWLATYRPWIRWAFIGYTALTIVLWLVMGERTPLGYFNKISEVLLLLLLLRVSPSR